MKPWKKERINISFSCLFHYLSPFSMHLVLTLWIKYLSNLLETWVWVFKNFPFSFRKMLMTTLYARQQKRHRCIEQSFGLCGRGRWGMIWENGSNTCIISYKKRIASPDSMQDTGSLGLVHWDEQFAFKTDHYFTFK